MPPSTVRERAYRHIQKLVSEGALQAGTPLSEPVLAKQLGSSRTPVREAIGQLVAEGLLEQTATGATLVVQLHREDVVDLYELREALETYAIDKIARAGVPLSDAERLQEHVDQILVLWHELERSGERSLNTEQMQRFLSSDLAFHSTMMSLAHNSRIQKVLDDMRLLIRIFAMNRRGHEAALLKKIHRQHQDILNAVLKGKAEAGRHLLSEHIRTSLAERLEEFNYWRREQYLAQSLPAYGAVRQAR